MPVATQEILATADFATLADIARNSHISSEPDSRQVIFKWLKENRKDMYYQVLGVLYDVSVYKIDGTGAFTNYPEDELGMFVVTYLSKDFPGAPRIPLQKTAAAGYRVAYELLGLEKLFEQEVLHGEDLPRICMGATLSISDLIAQIITEARDFDPLDASEMHMKISEENGELAEAMLVERGKLPGKKLKEPALGEGADVIIASICAIAKHYPSIPADELAMGLAKWVNVKTGKYFDKLHAPAPVPAPRSGRVGPVNKF